MSKPTHVHVGLAGEHRALSELLLRGLEPMRTTVDRGVDLVLPAGTKLQVKAARRQSYSGQFHWKIAKYRYGYRGEPTLRKEKSPEQPDFYLLWAVDDDRWFIIPVDKVPVDLASLSLNKHKPSLVSEFENAWHLLTEE